MCMQNLFPHIRIFILWRWTHNFFYFNNFLSYFLAGKNFFFFHYIHNLYTQSTSYSILSFLSSLSLFHSFAYILYFFCIISFFLFLHLHSRVYVRIFLLAHFLYHKFIIFFSFYIWTVSFARFNNILWRMSSHHQYALIFYQSDFFANIFFVHFFISLFAL